MHGGVRFGGVAHTVTTLVTACILVSMHCENCTHGVFGVLPVGASVVVAEVVAKPMVVEVAKSVVAEVVAKPMIVEVAK